MSWLGAVAGVVLIIAVLADAFKAMVLPRRVRRVFVVRLFYRVSWTVWRRLAALMPPGRRRHGLLSIFGPLMLLALVALWAFGLIAGFALLHWSLDTPLSDTGAGPLGYLYFSGTTFFTLGYGDMVPTGAAGRALSVIEAGLGFGFLALVISYLPVLYQAFSRREVIISLLDARAGSPPTAGELLRRVGGNLTKSGPPLAEWERWAAELLEAQLSYPVVSFYRSQHDNQSWVGALTVILDTSALMISQVDGADDYQARLTFAMARHAAVDLALVFETPPLPPEPDRLPAEGLAKLRATLRAAGLAVREGPAVAQALAELRALYEPYVNALAALFLYALPPVQPERSPVDNWQTSAWAQRSPGLSELPAGGDDHFDAGPPAGAG
jgi:hypothetical protein